MANSITSRNVADSVRNIVDYLWYADLLLNSTNIFESGHRVSWHPHNPAIPFLESRDHTTVEQYRSWIAAGHYSCILFDGSILQISYDLEKTGVVGHRLAYVPCPWDIDYILLNEGFALDEVLDLSDSDTVSLRSPIRFDFDLKARKSS